MAHVFEWSSFSIGTQPITNFDADVNAMLADGWEIVNSQWDTAGSWVFLVRR